jgi:aminoglycoside phosphotransferase (APT) family kinase protein
VELLASGRDGDIFAFAPGLVLRKTRDGRSIAHEARIMEYVAGHGYPVPHIEEVRADGTEIVMERIDGPLMMDTMVKGRIRGLRNGVQLLADLHDRLHVIPAPEWLPSLEEGDRVLHLDLHPLNVIETERGPVVIDWGNARSGDGLTDVALTYVLLTCPRMPGPWITRIAVQPMRAWLGNQFVQRYRGPELNARIARAAELKALDPNMLPEEVKKLRRLARKAAKAPG